MAKSVAALLEEIRLLGDEQYAIVESVRVLAQKQIQPLSEEVKYGGILFVSDAHVGGVFAYKEHVSVEFGQGARMQDPHGVLEGTGKGRRHIKLRSLSEVSTKAVATYLALALDAARSAS